MNLREQLKIPQLYLSRSAPKRIGRLSTRLTSLEDFHQNIYQNKQSANPQSSASIYYKNRLKIYPKGFFKQIILPSKYLDYQYDSNNSCKKYYSRLDCNKSYQRLNFYCGNNKRNEDKKKIRQSSISIQLKLQGLLNKTEKKTNMSSSNEKNQLKDYYRQSRQYRQKLINQRNSFLRKISDRQQRSRQQQSNNSFSFEKYTKDEKKDHQIDLNYSQVRSQKQSKKHTKKPSICSESVDNNYVQKYQLQEFQNKNIKYSNFEKQKSIYTNILNQKKHKHQLEHEMNKLSLNRSFDLSVTVSKTNDSQKNIPTVNVNNKLKEDKWQIIQKRQQLIKSLSIDHANFNTQMALKTLQFEKISTGIDKDDGFLEKQAERAYFLIDKLSQAQRQCIYFNKSLLNQINVTLQKQLNKYPLAFEKFIHKQY